MADLLDRCPEELQMVLIDQMAEPLLAEPSQGPYVVCALQECRRMNVLLGVITKSLSDLEKGPGRHLEHDASDRRLNCGSHNLRVAREKSVHAVRLGEVLLAVQEELIAPIRRHDQKTWAT